MFGQENSQECSKGLFVKCIPPEWDEVELRDFMCRYGNVTSARINKRDVSTTGFSFGFVYYETTEEARKALYYVRKNPHNLRVEAVRPQSSISQQSRPVRHSNEFSKTPNSDTEVVVKDQETQQTDQECQPHGGEQTLVPLTVHCSGDQRAVLYKTVPKISPNFDFAANSHQKDPEAQFQKKTNFRSSSMHHRRYQQTRCSPHFDNKAHYDSNSYGADSIDTTNGDDVPASKRLSFRNAQNLLAIDMPVQKSLRPVLRQNVEEECPQLARLTSPCTNCGIAGEFACTRCKACYCSKHCQEQHWSLHMNLCLQKSQSVSPHQDVKYQDSKREIADPSIVKALKLVTVSDIVKSDSLMNEIPSVFDRLEVGMKVGIYPVFQQENICCSWIYFGDILKNTKDMEAELQNQHGEDISHVVEEGDLAISYCPEGKRWYRSYVMQRMKYSVKVRFIDYGKEVNVTKICKISKQHLGVCCPLVLFDITNLRGEIKNLCQAMSLSVTITALSEAEVTVLFHLKNINISMPGTPWFTGLGMASEVVEVNEDDVASTKPFPIPRQLKKSPEKDVRLQRQRRFYLGERKLDAAEVCEVRISWRHFDNNNLYIQKCCDGYELIKMNEDINNHCESIEKFCYVPKDKEIVFAENRNQWFRAQVLKVFPDTVKVCLVDKGVLCKVDLSNILPFDDQFAAPKYAYVVRVQDTSILPYNPSKITFNMKVIDLNRTLPIVELRAIETSPPPRVNSLSLKSVSEENRQVKGVTGKTIKKSSLKLTLHKFHNATVCLVEIDELKVFHVQLTSNTEEYIAMKKEIQVCFEKRWMPGYKPELDDLVVVTYEKKYHRGCILENRSDSCLVKFIDAGITQVISVKDIRPLTASSNLNTFCLAVELDGLKLQMSRQELLELFLYVAMKLEITDFNSVPVKGKFYVEDECVNEQFLNDSKNDSTLADSSNPPVSLICKPKVLFESLACQTVPINENVDVVFWVKKNDKYIMQLVSDTSSIKKMSDALHEYCTKTEQLQTMPAIDEVVCAQSKDDHQWYRACVKQHLSKSKCLVTFFDYGNSEEVELSSLRSVPKEFATVSVYGISVSAIDVPQNLLFGKPYTVATAHLANSIIVGFVNVVGPTVGQPASSRSIVPASN